MCRSGSQDGSLTCAEGTLSGTPNGRADGTRTNSWNGTRQLHRPG
jgi:hypothetical protein